MTCIRTGADVFVESEGAIYHGDLYKVAGVYIFRHTDCPHYDYLPAHLKKCSLFINDGSVIGDSLIDHMGRQIVVSETICSPFSYYGFPER